MGMVRLRMIGSADLRKPDGSELRAVLAQPRRLALLAYLAAASPRGFHRRDAILSLFWPDHEQSRARASLNRALYFLRQELGDGILVSRGAEEVGLDASRFWCDVAQFDDAVETRRWRDALDLHRGDLLPGFFVSDAAGFEQWLESQRARLRERACDAAWTCAEEAEAAGDLTSAGHWARRGFELAPFREAAVRRLLSLLDRAGDRVGAAHAYNRFAQEIAAELDLVPTPETRALIDAIRARTEQRASATAATPSAAPRPSTPLVDASRPRESTHGRSRTRARLRAIAWGIPIATLAVALLTTRTLLARDESLDISRIDVVTFENRTGDASLENLARTATDRVIGGLRETGLFKNIRPVQPQMAGAMRTAWRKLVRVGRSGPTRSGVIVSGTLTRENDTLTIRARLQEARNGGVVWELRPIAVSPLAPAGAMNEVRDRVIGGAAALRDSRFVRVIPHATSPPTFDAYHEYAEASRLVESRHSDEGVSRYRVAAALDSTFTWALVQAARTELFEVRRSANVALVDSLLAILAARRARTPQLPLLQRHLVDYMAAVRVEDWRAAHTAMWQAAELAPLAYSYRLAVDAMHLNRPREIVEVLERPGLDSVYRDDAPNYWHMLTLGYHLLGEHRNELAAARRARHNRPDSPRALTHEIKALAALGRIDAVRARVDTVMALPRETWFTPAHAMMTAAEELRAHGHLEASREMTARAVAWDLSRPAEERAGEGRRWHLGMALYLHEDWVAADSIFRTLNREFPNSEEYLGFVGVIAARRGDRLTAQSIAAQLASRERAISLPGAPAVMWRAKIAAVLGDRDLAVRLLREAYGAQGTVEMHADKDFEGLRDYAAFREFIRPKG